MSEEDKQRLKEYQKNYREAKNIFHRCKKKLYFYLKKIQNCYHKDIVC